MIGLLIVILIAALAYWLMVALTGSAILGIVVALIVLLGGVSRGGSGWNRW